MIEELGPLKILSDDQNVLVAIQQSRPCDGVGCTKPKGRITCTCSKCFCEKCWIEHQKLFTNNGCPSALDDATATAPVPDGAPPPSVPEHDGGPRITVPSKNQDVQEPYLYRHRKAEKAEMMLELLRRQNLFVNCKTCGVPRSFPDDLNEQGVCKDGCSCPGSSSGTTNEQPSVPLVCEFVE